MISFFCVPKPFNGHVNIIQRNAIQSWTKLKPSCEIMLLGNEDGTAELAEEFKLTHIPQVSCNEFGTPLLDSIFHEAATHARHPLLCYVNADIVLLDDFMEAAQLVADQKSWFVMSGQRWNMEVTELLKFEPGWEDGLKELVQEKGWLHHRTATDYFLFSKGVFDGIPPFAIGRTAWDAWLLFRARQQGADLIDATRVIMDIHQNHDYSHHPEGDAGVWFGPESRINLELTGGRPFLFMIKDRTFDLTKEGLKPARDLWRLWRLLRTAEAIWPSIPWPVRLTLRGTNSLIDFSRKLLIALKLKKPYQIYTSRPH